jgi:hypothetical protein
MDTPSPPYDPDWEENVKDRTNSMYMPSRTVIFQSLKFGLQGFPSHTGQEYTLGKDAHPDGHEAYAALQLVKEDLRQFLKQMVDFWSDTNKEFMELAGLQSLTQQYIADQAKKWEEYQLASIKASVNMTNASDALVIRVIGTPKRPGRSGNSKGWKKALAYMNGVLVFITGKGIEILNELQDTFGGDDESTAETLEG